MCRLFISHSNGKMILDLYDSLRKAAENDIFYHNISHKDGWGYYIVNNRYSTYYKTVVPIYRDNNLTMLDEKDMYWSVFHARLAAEHQPTRGFIDSHPYLVYTSSSLIALAHNGVVDKYIISKELNIDAELYTDSEILSLLLSRFNEKDITTSLYELHKYVKELGAFKGTFNVIAIKIQRLSKEEIKISSACISDYPDKGIDNYKKMILYKSNNGSAAMSSTVAYYYGLLDKEGKVINPNAIVCEKGTVYEI